MTKLMTIKMSKYVSKFIEQASEWLNECFENKTNAYLWRYRNNSSYFLFILLYPIFFIPFLNTFFVCILIKFSETCTYLHIIENITIC